ncbi:DUF6069 family protein [Thermus sediminis]|uniref:DUF6069 family protein n=1 Tax=Thermus sediminis TaxID=1761908 RepID=UPI000E3CD9FD|nr:DUF6069 family protein [Thermus sediminis]
MGANTAPWNLALAALGVALGTNLLLFLLAGAVGVPFQVTPPGQPPQEVALASVALFTVLPMLLGFALYFPLRRRTPRALPIFVGLALAVFLLMLFPPFAAAPRPDTRLALLALHVPPVAAFLWTLFRVEREMAHGP